MDTSTFLALAADPTSGIDPALVAGLVALTGVALISWQLHRLITRLERQGDPQESLRKLGEIEDKLGRLGSGGDGLDRRRLEHVLMDIRDGNKRFEERLMALIEMQGGRAGSVPEGKAGALSISERVTNRLLAMGFERIDVLTPMDELEAIGDGAGEVQVEARRAGVAHKGHVVLRKGTIADVRLREGYEAFP